MQCIPNRLTWQSSNRDSLLSWHGAARAFAPQCQQTRSKHTTLLQKCTEFVTCTRQSLAASCCNSRHRTPDVTCTQYLLLAYPRAWTVSISNVNERGHSQHKSFFHVTLSNRASLTRTAAASSQHITACLHALADQHPYLPNQVEILRCHACFQGHHSY